MRSRLVLATKFCKQCDGVFACHLRDAIEEECSILSKQEVISVVETLSA